MNTNENNKARTGNVTSAAGQDDTQNRNDRSSSSPEAQHRMAQTPRQGENTGEEGYTSRGRNNDGTEMGDTYDMNNQDRNAGSERFHSRHRDKDDGAQP